MITVAAGATSAAIRLMTALVTASTAVTITASHATTQKTAVLTVLPPAGNYVAALEVAPAFIVAGTTAVGRVTVAQAAGGQGGSDVTLTSSHAAVSVPATITVRPNATTASFTVARMAISVRAAGLYGDVAGRDRWKGVRFYEVRARI